VEGEPSSLFLPNRHKKGVFVLEILIWLLLAVAHYIILYFVIKNAIESTSLLDGMEKTINTLERIEKELKKNNS